MQREQTEGKAISHATRIAAGQYRYEEYMVTNLGYSYDEHGPGWNGVNEQTGLEECRMPSKRKVLRAIDEKNRK